MSDAPSPSDAAPASDAPADLLAAARAIELYDERRLELLRRAAAGFAEAGDRKGEAEATLEIAIHYSSELALDEIDRHARQAADLFEQIGDRAGEGVAWYHIAMAADFGDSASLSDRRALYDRAIDRLTGSDELAWLSTCHAGAGHCALAAGDLDDAERCFTAALAAGQQTGLLYPVPDNHHSLAKVFAQRGEDHRAVAELYAALSSLTRIRMRTMARIREAACLELLGDIHHALQQPAPARAAYRWALLLLQRADHRKMKDVQQKLDAMGDA